MLRTVFVSSTFQDLQTHRKAVWDVLGNFDVSIRGMEQFGARTETPLQTCLLELEQADIYVGIIAFRLGSIDETTSKSFTQLEYERALALSKEIFIYLVDEENARVPVKYIDQGESRDKLEGFKRVLRERHTIDTFVDETDLAEKLQGTLQRHLMPRNQPTDGADEFTTSKAKLLQFYLMPKSVAGSEVRLWLRVKSAPYPASHAVCKTFNFEFGSTVGLPVEVVKPEGVDLRDLTDLFMNSKHATEVLPIDKGDILDCHVRLHFSDKEIEELRARYRPHTEYPDSPYEQITMASVLGRAVHYHSDSRLAMELAKPLTTQRTKGSTV